jgi:hypothetical protein
MVFALLGMQLFGGKFNFDDGKPNQNYDDFISDNGCITTF